MQIAWIIRLGVSVLLFVPLTSKAYTPEFGITYDRNLSPYVGAELINTGLRGYQYLDDILLPSSSGKQNLWWWVARSAKWLFIEFPLSSFAHIAQHEVFGHGYRLREYNIGSVSYDLFIASGATYFNETQYNNLHPHQQALVTSGGMEANDLLATRIRNQWLMDGTIDTREANLYWLSYYDQTGYIQSFNDDRTSTVGHDVNQYVSIVNSWHGKTAISHRSLRRKAIYDHFEPFYWYSIWSFLNYIYTGQQETDYYMINIVGGYKYLPGMRMLLAPYGPEMSLRNYIVGPNQQLILVNLRYGNTGGKKSFALDLNLRNFTIMQQFSIHSRFHMGRQPGAKVGMTATNNKYELLMAPFVGLEYRYTEMVAFTSEIGYKTAGYVPGEPLEQSFVGRLGFKFDLS